MGGQARPEEGDEARGPLAGGGRDGDDAAPGVQGVRVRDGGAGQAVAVPGRLHPQTGKHRGCPHDRGVRHLQLRLPLVPRQPEERKLNTEVLHL